MKEKIEKAIQEKPEPQEIKFKIESGRMVFDMGDRQFFLKEEQANFLFGRNVGARFEQLRAEEREDFSDLYTSDFLAKFAVANKFYGNFQDAAKYLKVNEQRLKRWLTDYYSQEQHNKLMFYDGKFGYQESYKKYRLELFGEEKREEKAFNPDLKTIDKIGNFLADGMTPRQIAPRLKVNYGSFINWFSKKEYHSRVQLAMNNEISRRQSLESQEKHEG